MGACSTDFGKMACNMEKVPTLVHKGRNVKVYGKTVNASVKKRKNIEVIACFLIS